MAAAQELGSRNMKSSLLGKRRKAITTKEGNGKLSSEAQEEGY